MEDRTTSDEGPCPCYSSSQNWVMSSPLNQSTQAGKWNLSLNKQCAKGFTMGIGMSCRVGVWISRSGRGHHSQVGRYTRACGRCKMPSLSVWCLTVTLGGEWGGHRNTVPGQHHPQTGRCLCGLCPVPARSPFQLADIKHMTQYY